jgi:hypothetical protein
MSSCLSISIRISEFILFIQHLPRSTVFTWNIPIDDIWIFSCRTSLRCRSDWENDRSSHLFMQLIQPRKCFGVACSIVDTIHSSICLATGYSYEQNDWHYLMTWSSHRSSSIRRNSLCILLYRCDKIDIVVSIGQSQPSDISEDVLTVLCVASWQDLFILLIWPNEWSLQESSHLLITRTDRVFTSIWQ